MAEMDPTQDVTEHSLWPSPDSTIRVLYIAGFGRSGTTILANLLGELDGFVSVGELNMLWERYRFEERFCGCARPMVECSFWRAVFERAFGGFDGVDQQAVGRLLRRHGRSRHFPLRAVRWAHDSDPDLKALREVLGRLYAAIAAVSRSRIIVDSSKRPVYGRLLASIPGVRVQVLHLVRDPRAVAFSWSRDRMLPFLNRPATKMSAVKSSLLWIGLNLITERMLWGTSPKNHYRRLRYEDFVAAPRESVHRALAFLEEPDEQDPFITDSRVSLSTHHTVAGNVSRHRAGQVELRADMEWVKAMPPGRKTLVALMTWPLMVKYGYTLRSG